MGDRPRTPPSIASTRSIHSAPPERSEPVTDAPIEDPEEPSRFMLLLDDDERDLFAISRPFGEDVLVIVANWANEAHGMRIPKPAPGHYELVQATTEEPYRIQADEDGIIFEIGARTVQVLRRVEHTEPNTGLETANSREQTRINANRHSQSSQVAAFVVRST